MYPQQMVRPQLQRTTLAIPDSPGYDHFIPVGPLQPFYRKARYSKVSCLLLKWRNHDLPGLDEEVMNESSFYFMCYEICT
jgi:hypothetical protein